MTVRRSLCYHYVIYAVILLQLCHTSVSFITTNEQPCANRITQKPPNAGLRPTHPPITRPQAKRRCQPNTSRHSTTYRISRLPASSTPSDNDIDADAKAKLGGTLVLLSVPLAWGTYAPVVKYVYAMDPPVPGILFSAGYYVLAAATLFGLSRLQDDRDIGPTTTVLPTVAESDGGMGDDRPAPLVSTGGIELGSYLFIGNCLQIVGLKTVPADRAAFLVQLTTIMVPLAQALIGGSLSSVPERTWLACIIAFLGVVVMGLDDGSSPLDVSTLDVSNIFGGEWFTTLSLSIGDGLIMLAAVAYTMHVVRLGKYARLTSPLDLAASKATVEAALSVALVSLLCFLPVGGGGSNGGTFWTDAGGEIKVYFQTLSDQLALSGSSGATIVADNVVSQGSVALAFAAVLWTGWVTCAYTIYAQSFGQRFVGPTNANLIYSTQPIFSALFAYVLLHESLGLTGYIGGGLIGFALYLIASYNGGSDSVISDIDTGCDVPVKESLGKLEP